MSLQLFNYPNVKSDDGLVKLWIEKNHIITAAETLAVEVNLTTDVLRNKAIFASALCQINSGGFSNCNQLAVWDNLLKIFDSEIQYLEGQSLQAVICHY